MPFVLHSCRNLVALVLLISHSFCTLVFYVVLVSLMLHSCHSCLELVLYNRLDLNKVEIKLPKLEIFTFNGDITMWQTFWGQFNLSIHSNEDISDENKFNYLHSFICDEAREVISRSATSSFNYKTAVNILQKRYGNTQVLPLSWNPPWRSERAYLTKRFHPSATTRGARRSDAPTFNKDKQIFLMPMPRTWLKIEEFTLE